MFKKILLTALLVVSVGFFASSAQANILNVGDGISFSDAPGSGPGGEFAVNVNPGNNTSWSNDVFRTFCIERNEFIGFGSGYVVDSISPSAVGGGEGGGSPDPVSVETKWLYFNFVNGTLTGYDYAGAGRAADADELQAAIWRLEDESHSAGLSAYYYGLATAWSAGASAADLAFYNARVFAINPVDGNGAHAQSMLYAVPEPGSLGIWGLAVAGVVVGSMIKRRNKRGQVVA